MCDINQLQIHIFDVHVPLIARGTRAPPSSMNTLRPVNTRRQHAAISGKARVEFNFTRCMPSQTTSFKDVELAVRCAQMFTSCMHQQSFVLRLLSSLQFETLSIKKIRPSLSQSQVRGICGKSLTITSCVCSASADPHMRHTSNTNRPAP